MLVLRPRPLLTSSASAHGRGQDATLDDGVRYLQAPLSYPDERKGRLGTVATGPNFPHGTPPTPLLVYNALERSFPPRYDAGWSNFYRLYQRQPGMSHIVAPYVAANFKPVPGIGKVGYLSEGDNPTSDVNGTPTPAWALGPSTAVDFEVQQRDAGRNMARNR